jgi:hypothetical protein
MDVETVYHFLHKAVRNLVPTRTAQRACIEGMRRFLFPETLADTRIDMDAALRDGTAEQRLLRPASSTPPAALVSLTGEIPDKLALPESPTPELNDYILREGYCFRFFVLDNKRRFISDATLPGLFGNALQRNNRDIRAKAPVRIAGDVIALNSGYVSNYYHWLVDLVGRMLLMPDWRDMRIITDTCYAYQKETLQLLGVPAGRVISITDYSLFQVERLHVVSAPWAVSRDSYMAVKSLADRLKPDPDRNERPKRLYISRGDAAQRRSIINERELLPILEEYGFQKVYFTGMPVEEQIRSMAAVDYVVFPHGAAGGNLLFCGPRMRFLEIHSPRLLDAAFVRISKAMGLTHHILIGTPGPDGGRHAPFRVDPAQLRDALALLLAP